ncbi:MAG TPA: SagB/ThcOx family dehydrogenase [Verrucomicrobiae bacterium]|nr:SagB/ThcOx family dehydrogenase [Verrucomicrobiae bacterium]
MKNHEIEAAWTYHNSTKHSYESIRRNRHYLDWENQPRPFKIYPKLEPISLPQELTSSGMPALMAMSVPAVDLRRQIIPTRQALAEMLFLSAGITKRRSYPGGEILFRAAACTGALYHIDLYLVCGDLQDLGAGVYQFSPQDFSLRRLRAGDYRSVLVESSGAEPSVAEAPCVVVSASTFWRNAWKYQSRAYRHCYWDNGTILANLLAAAAARKVPAKVVLGFVDATVIELLGLDGQREAPLSLAALGRATKSGAAPSPPLAPLALETAPLSKTEVDYPEIRAMHEASSLESAAEVKAWREKRRRAEGERIKDEGCTEHELIPLPPAADEGLPRDSFEEVIMRRGSTREFAREGITFEQLSIMLERTTRGIEADFLSSGDESLNDIYLIVHAVEGLPAGAYFYRRQENALELLKAGDFRSDAGYLGLGQEIPADCSVNVYFLADLNRALARFGNRGYRAAQLEAAIVGGKLYLAAYTQRLGASGLTFYDDDVTEFFSPHAAGKSVMFLIALGKSVKQRKGLAVV